MSEFKREERYIVVKLKHLAGLQVAPLRNFLRENRVPTLNCVVVESDWPEYEPVWQMIERRMSGQPAVTAAEELEAVLFWRDKHAVANRARDALQQRLTAADEALDKAADEFSLMSLEAGQRMDVLEGLLRDASAWIKHNSFHGTDAIELWERIDAALKRSKPFTCTWTEGGFSWHTGCGKEWQFTDGGLPAENGMHFCHSCGKTLVVESAESA